MDNDDNIDAMNDVGYNEAADGNGTVASASDHYYESISLPAAGRHSATNRLPDDDHYFSSRLLTPTASSEMSTGTSRLPQRNSSPAVASDFDPASFTRSQHRYRSAGLLSLAHSTQRSTNDDYDSNAHLDDTASTRTEAMGFLFSSSDYADAAASSTDANSGRRLQRDRATGSSVSTASARSSTTSAATTATTATIPNRAARGISTSSNPHAGGATSLPTPTSVADTSTPGGDSTTGTPTTIVPNAPTLPPTISSTSKTIHAVETLDELYRCHQLREVSGSGLHGNSSSLSEALSWQLSSAKPGNGVEQIRDSSVETYWQSDGITQPHWIEIHFQRRIAISYLALYLDYHLDESYTPKTIAVEVGTTPHDLVCATSPVSKIEFHEPSGWCIIPLCAPPDPLDSSDYFDDDNDDFHYSEMKNKKKNKNRGIVGDDDEHDEDEDDGEDESEESLNLEKQMHRPLLKAHMIRVSILSMHQNGRDTHVRRLALFARMQQQPSTTNIRIPPIPMSKQSVVDNDDDEVMDENEDEDSVLALPSAVAKQTMLQPSEYYIESWNHRRNTSSSCDFSTIGRNRFSTIR